MGWARGNSGCGRWLRRVLLATTLASGPVQSQVADLELVASTGEVIVTPLREQTVRLTVRNRGPDIVSSPIVTLGRRVEPSTLSVTTQPGCSVSADSNAAGVLYVWNVTTLSSGQNAHCDFTFRATAASPSDVLSFRIGASQAGNADPDALNNFVTLLVARSALDRPVDTMLSVRRIPGGIQPPGTTQRVELTISNRGTNAPERIAIVSTAYLVAGSVAGGYTGYDIHPRSDTPPCAFLRDLEPPAAQIQLLLAMPPPPGSSVVCSVDVVALPQTPAASTLEWDAFVRGAGVYDVDQLNNHASIQILFQAPLPVPLSPVALSIMAVLLALAVHSRFRGPLRQGPSQ